MISKADFQLVENAFSTSGKPTSITLGTSESNPEAIRDRDLFINYAWNELPPSIVRQNWEALYYFDNKAQLYYYPRLLLSLVDSDSDMDEYAAMSLTEQLFVAGDEWPVLSNVQKEVVLKILRRSLDRQEHIIADVVRLRQIYESLSHR